VEIDVYQRRTRVVGSETMCATLIAVAKVSGKESGMVNEMRRILESGGMRLLLPPPTQHHHWREPTTHHLDRLKRRLTCFDDFQSISFVPDKDSCCVGQCPKYSLFDGQMRRL